MNHGKPLLFLFRLCIGLAGLSGVQVALADPTAVYGCYFKITVHGSGQFNNVFAYTGGTAYGSFNTAHTAGVFNYGPYTLYTEVQSFRARASDGNGDPLGPDSVAQPVTLGKTLYEFDVYINGATAEEHWSFQDCRLNQRNYPIEISWFDAANPTAPALATKTVQPGATECVTLGSFGAKKAIEVYMTDPTGTVSPLAGIPANDPDWYPTGGTSTPNNGAVPWTASYPGGMIGGTIPNINFPASTTDLAKESTLQVGFQQLKNAAVEQSAFVAQGVVIAHNDSLTHATKLDAVTAAVNGQSSAIGGLNTGINSVISSSGAVKTAVDGVSAAVGGVQTAVAAGNAVSSSQLISLEAIRGLAGDVKTGVAANTASTEALNVKATTANSTLLGILNKQDELTTIRGGIAAGNGSASTTAGNTESIKTDMGYVRNHLSDIKANSTTSTEYGRRQMVAAESTAVDTKKLADAISAPGSEGDRIGREQSALSGFVSSGNAAGSAAGGGWSSSGASVSVPSELVASADASIFMLHFGDKSLDLDPGHVSYMVSFGTWTKKLLEWGISILYLFACFKVVEGYMTNIGAVQQGKALNLSIAGFSVGAVTGPLWAAAIIAALVAFSTFALHFLTAAGGPLDFFGGAHPLASAPQAVIYLINFFFPLQFALAHLGLYIAFRLNIGGAWMVATTIVRFIVGG